MTDLDALMVSDAPVASDDRLEQIRRVARKRRDLATIKADLQERLTEVNIEIQTIEHETLPTMFVDARVDSVGLPAEGNHPAFEAKLKPHYYANIAAAWPEERRREGFEELQEIGLGDILKTEVVVSFDREQDDERKSFIAVLDDLDVDYVERHSVPWNTLTAAVKDVYDHGKKLSAETLDKIGATIGRVVTLRARDTL